MGEDAADKVTPLRNKRTRKPKQADLPGAEGKAAGQPRTNRVRVPAFDIPEIRFGVPITKPVKIPGTPVRRDTIIVTVYIPKTEEIWRRIKALQGQTAAGRLEPVQAEMPLEADEA
jgi:hypothetical protein